LGRIGALGEIVGGGVGIVLSRMDTHPEEFYGVSQITISLIVRKKTYI
jgi:hypothetical protein